MHLTASLKTMVAVAVAAVAILAFALLVSPGAPASSSVGAGDPLPNATPGPHGSNPPGYVFASGRR
jgi:hypothetical protein